MPNNCSSSDAELDRHVRVQVRQRAAHSLRPAGRARGVMHGGTGSPVGRQADRLPVAQRLNRGEARYLAIAESCPRRQVRQVSGGRGDGREALMHEQRLGLAVPDDIRHLRGGEVPVDRRQIPARLERGQVQLQRRHAVGQYGGNPVSRPQPAGPQPVGDLIHPAEQVTCGVLRSIRLDRGDPLRALLRTAPEPYSHRGPPCSTRRATAPAQDRSRACPRLARQDPDKILKNLGMD